LLRSTAAASPSERSPARRRQETQRYAVPRSSAIPNEQWPAIIVRAEHEGTRSIARDLGVSHVGVCAALRAAGRADLLADPGRRRRLEATASTPPLPTRKIPLERHAEVRRLCERYTQAEVAAMFGVSQDTIWRIVHGRRHELPSALPTCHPYSVRVDWWMHGQRCGDTATATDLAGTMAFSAAPVAGVID
jgi:hypothetical protein